MILTDYRFLLDVHEINSQISLSFKQGDTGRGLYITLTENGDIFNIPQHCVAVFTALKPDGTIIFNDCEINGNEIVYTHTAQTAAVTGKVDCELRLYGAGNTLITSPHFTIFVHPTVYFDQIESKDEINTLTNLIYEASTKLANGDFVPKLGIGEVKTLPAGSMATVEMSGEASAPILNFAIPQGEQGQAESLVPDTALSLNSTKPVQNSVITAALNAKADAAATAEAFEEMSEALNAKADAVATAEAFEEMAEEIGNKADVKGTAEALNTKVDKESNKGLSTNDFTNDYRDKVDGMDQSLTRALDGAKPLYYDNITVPDSAWNPDSTFADYPYRAAVPLAGITKNHYVDVGFGEQTVAFSSIADSYDGGIYIFAKEYPERLVRINSVIAINSKTTEIESNVFATISVTYQKGKICTCTDGTTTLLANTTSGSWEFGVPNAGEWIVSTGEDYLIVNITTQGQSESVELSNGKLWLFKNGDQCNDLTGGWTSTGYQVLDGYTTKAANIGSEIVLDTRGTEKYTIINAGTANKIDISNISKLFVNVSEIMAQYVAFYIFNNKSDVNEDALKVSACYAGVNEIDVSTISGSYYIALSCAHTSSGERAGKVSQVWGA